MSARRLPDFITSFCSYAATFNTTPHFAKFAALWQVGTAVTRQVAMESRGTFTCPNLFIEMVGGPGTGKSRAVAAVRSIFIPATKMSIIPASITRAGLEDYMQNNMHQRKTPDGVMSLSNECIGLSEEMQGILPDQDLGHLTLYNILYDLPHIHKARTRSNGEVNLEAPYCSILTGAQPAFLAQTMPELAWGMGFMSRSIMVFDTPTERKSLFESMTIDHKLQADLIHDLKQIAALVGWMKWTKPAIKLYETWWVEHGGLPVPTAKRLAMGYNSRREIHMVKLAMIFSLSRSNDLIIDLPDVQKAIQLLLLTEERMKYIFQEMTNTGSQAAIEEAIDIVRTNQAAGKATHESVLIEFVMQRFPSTQVHATVENLVTAQAIKVSNEKGSLNARGFRMFILGDRAAML